jgi:hypothetical protein
MNKTRFYKNGDGSPFRCLVKQRAQRSITTVWSGRESLSLCKPSLKSPLVTFRSSSRSGALSASSQGPGDTSFKYLDIRLLKD